MQRKQVKIEVLDLLVDMYVSTLDRPWIDTPYPLEGFFIRKESDISKLRGYCSYVYIDVIKGRSPEKSTRQLAGLDSSQVQPIKVKRDIYLKAQPAEKEIAHASVVYDHASSVIEQTISALKETGALTSLAPMQKVATGMAASVIRNPDALLWLSTMRAKDEFLYSHSIRAAVWSAILGRHIGLTEGALASLLMGVMLSGVGKTKLPAELLAREGKLNIKEQQYYQRHVAYSVSMLKNTEGINAQVLSVVAGIHERHDGSGYPRQVKGEKIPLLAKLAGIADEFDGMVNPRYGEVLSAAEAASKLFELAGVYFQQDLVEEFVQAIGVYPTGTVVELSNQEVGYVFAQNEGRRLRPKLMLVLDKNKKPFKRSRIVDLMTQTKDRKGGLLNITSSLPLGAYGINPISGSAELQVSPSVLDKTKQGLSNLFA